MVLASWRRTQELKNPEVPKAAKILVTFAVRVYSEYPRHQRSYHSVSHDLAVPLHRLIRKVDLVVAAVRPPGDVAPGHPPRVASQRRARGPDLRDLHVMRNTIGVAMTGGTFKDIIPKSDIEVGATTD